MWVSRASRAPAAKPWPGLDLPYRSLQRAAAANYFDEIGAPIATRGSHKFRCQATASYATYSSVVQEPATLSTLLQRISFAIAVAVLVTYAADFAYVRVRMRHPTPTDPFETLTAPRLLAIPEKGNKTEYQIDVDNPTQTITCVHAIFPQAGHSPCWQIQRTLHQPIPM
jgi:hypothetical protein